MQDAAVVRPDLSRYSSIWQPYKSVFYTPCHLSFEKWTKLQVIESSSNISEHSEHYKTLSTIDVMTKKELNI